MAFQTTTLTTLQARLAEKYESVPFWTGEEARLAINEALRVWSGLTGMWRQRLTLPTVPNDPWLPIPGTLVLRTRVELGGMALQRVSLAQLQYARAAWQSETTASGGGVPTSVKVWAAAGLSLIAFWPADAAGNTSILVDGVAQTPVLVNGGDYIDLGDEELGVLLGFALHLLAFKAPDQVFQSTQPLQKAFYQDRKSTRLNSSHSQTSYAVV